MKDSKIARRDRAIKRFSVLTFTQWSYKWYYKLLKPVPDNASSLYDGYLNRKVTEAKALGLVSNNATLKTALNLLF